MEMADKREQRAGFEGETDSQMMRRGVGEEERWPPKPSGGREILGDQTRKWGDEAAAAAPAASRPRRQGSWNTTYPPATPPRNAALTFATKRKFRVAGKTLYRGEIKATKN